MKKLFTILLLLLFSAANIWAQDEELGKNEFSVWGGFSPDSSTVIKGTGRTEDARFGIAAFRYSRRFNNSDKVNLKIHSIGWLVLVVYQILCDRTLRWDDDIVKSP